MGFTTFEPAFEISLMQDDRHSVMNRHYVELKICVKERQGWSSRLAVQPDENSRGKGYAGPFSDATE